jgi:DNA-binding response OmpR family regulator
MEAKILLVDGDRWMQRVVMSALADQDYAVHTARDGFGGLASAMADPPDLIISDILVPGMSGWRLVRRLRSNRTLARTPFMFLTRLASAESRRHSFRLGADDYMLKPCHPNELQLRVAGLLRRAREAGAGGRGCGGRGAPERGRGLGGTIADISLASLLVLLEMERKTGLLVLSRADVGRRCRVFLREGRIVGALLDGDPTLRDAELLYHVLRWSSGVFEFKSLPVEMRDEVQISTTHLLIEASRRFDEADHDGGECDCALLEEEFG